MNLDIDKIKDEIAKFADKFHNTEEENVDETVCQEADRLVSLDRQEQYGHPYNNFTDIGRFWGTILGIPDIAPETVALMMAALKIAREKFKPHRDNRVDMAGYAKVIDLILERKKELEKNVIDDTDVEDDVEDFEDYINEIPLNSEFHFPYETFNDYLLDSLRSKVATFLERHNKNNE